MNSRLRHDLLTAVLAMIWLTNSLFAKEPNAFRTFFVTRSLGHERLSEYLESARPEVVQIGNYGAMFHGFADNLRATKSPMMLPVIGERATLDFQKKLNAKVKALGSKVVGHFRLVKVMGDWKEQSGFVDYYNNRWPTDLLGAKPHPQLSELLQRDANGQPVQVSRYDNAQLTLCLSSPHARNMLKAMLRCAIDHGVDGVVTTYNYRFECACPYCQKAFKEWLEKQLTADEIRERLDIENLGQHKFPVIPARIPGYPDVEKASDLDWLAMRWGAEHFKQMYDEIFLDYGRAIRKDLMVAQWNHLNHVSISEERMFLPLPLWGRGEDYFWYSGGSAFVGRNLNLKERKAGDAWLSCLCVRELSGGKPFVMGKYDGIRLAASMAEGYATGGIGMGRYMRFEQPAGFQTLTRYTQFMHTHRRLYDALQPFSDVALVLPRQSVWNGRADALDDFRSVGQSLVQRQVLLDVVADENLSRNRLAGYNAIILPRFTALSAEQLAVLHSFSADGGLILHRGSAAFVQESSRDSQQDRVIRQHGDALPTDSVRLGGDVAQAVDSAITHLQQRGASVITSPWTVRACAYSQPDRVVLHLVNYDRNEAVDKRLSGPELERPKSVRDIHVNLRLPQAMKVTSVKLHSPENVESLELRFDQSTRQRVGFQIPQIQVYAVVEISTE